MKRDIKTIREALKVQAEFLVSLAISVREENPPLSYSYFTHSEICKQAVEEMERLEPAEIETEGDRYTWFNVCGECHGQIDQMDKFCRHCGHPIVMQK